MRSYLAHHQGMGLCAITNRLLGDVHCRRLHTEPAVRAAELLLQERVPLDAHEVRGPETDTEGLTPATASTEVSRRLTTADTPAPRCHLLSNGSYTVMRTNAGSGYSARGALAVNKWRADPTADPDGSFIYVRDPVTSREWSVGHQPLGAKPEYYEVVFSADKAEIRRRDGAVETQFELVVAPDADVEVRRITLVNHDTRPCTLEVTSLIELVLNDRRADLAHPAFGKLFLETEWLPQNDALVCRRRPRAADQAPLFAVHLVATDGNSGASPSTKPIARSSWAGAGAPPIPTDW